MSSEHSSRSISASVNKVDPRPTSSSKDNGSVRHNGELQTNEWFDIGDLSQHDDLGREAPLMHHTTARTLLHHAIALGSPISIKEISCLLDEKNVFWIRFRLTSHGAGIVPSPNQNVSSHTEIKIPGTIRDSPESMGRHIGGDEWLPIGDKMWINGKPRDMHLGPGDSIPIRYYGKDNRQGRFHLSRASIRKFFDRFGPTDKKRDGT